MATSRSTLATALAGFALAGLLLSGCATGGSDAEAPDSSGGSNAESSQSTEEGCTVLKEGVSGTMEELQSGMADMQTDPDAAAAAVGTLAEAFAETAADIDNTDVRAVADSATDALNNFDEQIAAYAADPEGADQAAVNDAATAVQEAMAKLGATCP